jgi:CRISPR system Cascade subunit CasA
MSHRPFSLITDPWLPVRRAISGPALIRPCEITSNLGTDPVIALDWPRADFRVACLELLIGLFATACAPANNDAWSQRRKNPPPPDVLSAAFAPLEPAFILDGPGPCFCQDLEDFGGKTVPVERLLIDAPGEEAVKSNRDLLVKRDRIAALGRPAAAMALYTLQAFAPAGGSGYRTSLRGGGPLITLVIPPQFGDAPIPLWQLLWANVPNAGEAPVTAADLPKVFPWLAPTRRSVGDVGTVLGSGDAHPLQAFWGLPCCVRLDFRQAQTGEVCSLTGRPDTVLATALRKRPYGVQYVQSVHYHPLSPRYRAKKNEPWLAVHPQPDGVGYRHWHNFVETDDMAAAAGTVTTFNERKPLREGKAWDTARLLIAGYDMDKAKARAFIEAEMPLFLGEAPKLRNFLAFSRRMAVGATEASRILRSQVANALQLDGIDNSIVDSARQRFFEDTTIAFWDMLHDNLDKRDWSEALADDAPARAWLATLRVHAMRLFDETAPLDPLSPDATGKLKNGKWEPPPIIIARRNLGLGLAGYGKKSGEILFRELGLSRDEPKKKPKKGRA